MKRRQFLLVLSDLHRGAAISGMPVHEKELCDKMAGFDHVVLNGDIFELFYVDRRYYGFGPGQKNEDTTHIIRHAIKSSIQFLDQFLTDHPKTKLHFVLGNHENIQKFRHQLDGLVSRHKNFEWSPEAIRIGDALFVHGDLPMSDKTNRTREHYNLKAATKDLRWTDWVSRFDRPGQAVVNYLRSCDRATGYVQAWLKKNDGKDTLSYRHNGKKKHFEMGWVKHVFFGHTHVKFDNYERDGILYHNTGALTKTVLDKGGHGMLEATIGEDGRVTDVQPFALSQDIERNHHWGGQAGR